MTTKFSEILRGRFGFLLLVAVFLPVMLYRGSRESSIWIDEVYSILLIQKDVAGIIDATAIDAHPPLYYLALNCWEAAVAAVWPGAGVLRVRSFNILMGTILLGIIWRGCRTLADETQGTLIAWVACAGPGILQMVKETRSYALAAMFLTACFFLLFVQDRKRCGWRKSIGLWFVYSVCAAAALWTHYLSALLLAILGVAWIIMEVTSRPFARRDFALGVGAQALAVVLASPLAFAVARQAHHVAIQGNWTTPATVFNLFSVFAFWYPFGRVGSPVVSVHWPALILGVLCFLAPLGAFFITRRKPSAVARLSLISVSIAVVYNVLLWLVARYTSLQLFHGPRYSLLVMPIWLIGLGSAAVAVGTAREWRIGLTALLLAPLLLASGIGQAWVIHVEKERGLKRWLETDAARYVPPMDEPLYVYPEELLPYFQESLEHRVVVPLSELPEHAEKSAIILNLSFWENLLPPRDLLFRKLMSEDVLAAQHFSFDGPEYELHRLVNINNEVIAAGFAPREFVGSPSAVSVASPQQQKRRRGWSLLEPTVEGEFFRWSNVGRSPIEFREEVEPGTYTVHLRGARPDLVMAQGEMTLQVEGEKEIIRVNPPAGEFHLELTVIVSRRGRPVLWVEHPAWTQDAAGIRPGDLRPYSFIFRGAWLER